MATEKSTVRKLVQAAVNAGYLVAVRDDEGIIQKKTADVGAVLSAAFDLDECTLRVWKKTTETPKKSDCVAAFFLVFGNAVDGSEVFADWSDNDAANNLLNQIGYLD